MLFQFLYVNQSFAPAPDVEVGTLYEVSRTLAPFHFSCAGKYFRLWVKESEEGNEGQPSKALLESIFSYVLYFLNKHHENNLEVSCQANGQMRFGLTGFFQICLLCLHFIRWVGVEGSAPYFRQSWNLFKVYMFSGLASSILGEVKRREASFGGKMVAESACLVFLFHFSVFWK